MRWFFSQTITLPTWFVILMTLLVVAGQWTVERSAAALRDLFSDYWRAQHGEAFPPRVVEETE
jgi:hypothetical protein